MEENPYEAPQPEGKNDSPPPFPRKLDLSRIAPQKALKPKPPSPYWWLLMLPITALAALPSALGMNGMLGFIIPIALGALLIHKMTNHETY